MGIAAALAIGAGAGASAGGGIFSGLMGSSAARRQAEAIRAAGDQGANAILAGVDKANETAQAFNTTARGDLSPFRQFGVDAGNTLTSLLFGGGDVSQALRASPLFNFQSELGSRNLNRELSARGLYGSGAGLEALAQFNNQLVGDEGQRLVDRLFNLTGLGSNAANSMASLTNQTGLTMADTIFRGRNAAAQMRFDSAIGAAQKRADATNMIGQSLGGAMSQLGSTLANYGLYMPQIQSAANLNNAMASQYGMTSASDRALAEKHGIALS